MNVLVCGANGFIGAALCARLEAEGHCVVKGVRHAARPDEIAIDYTRDIQPEQWRSHLVGIDAVINAVGILVERGAQTFDAVHRQAPIALFKACAIAGVRRVIQISALGVDRTNSEYFRSKLAADTFLSICPISFQILRPALVYGKSGTSANLFRQLASLPCHFLPAGGRQRLRPVHIDDLTETIACLLDPSAQDRQHIDVVGATEVEYRQMLSLYRAGMKLPPALRVTLPRTLIDIAATLLDRVPGSMLTRDTWQMLQDGSTADVRSTNEVLGRSPLGVQQFIGIDAAILRREAFAAWTPKVFRGALAVTWIWTAVVSAFLYPQADSLALLARMQLHGVTAVVALYLAAALDFLLGLATVFRPGRRLWMGQALLVAAYSVSVALAMPESLIDPFGPILKNLPILAILLVLFSEEATQ
jgi:uncharacterized protein YbjT (DUF2867 family)